ncbi:MAG TPA: CPBP family intramembrane glutamic endopeptidase [Kofleriaceae bacterium]|nr:CPBP family intramembrane glutamic endopeptidase [Kofleriaceae bacterium]
MIRPVEPEPARGAPVRDAVIALVVVAALVCVLVQIPLTLPWIGHVGSALVAVVFLYVPVIVAGRRGEDLRDYGFVWQPVGRGLALAGAAIAIIVPLFALGFFAFYQLFCHAGWLAQLAPARVCAHFGGLASLHAPRWLWAEPGAPVPNALSAEWCAVQWLVVALPEELFFRGFLLEKLEQRFPPARRWLGGGIGWALVLSSAAFAVIHLPKDGDPRALATFFPGLLFGWLRSATRSILAPTITHGAANILARTLEIALSR